MSAILEETIEIKIGISIIINKNQLDFDKCPTDDELRAGAERILTTMSAENLRNILLFTNSKTEYLYTDNNGVTVELK
tara:strand:- start:1585 stop:1818 length:234 start_codon:yes stop_codon:yes gene_type:complete